MHYTDSQIESPNWLCSAQFSARAIHSHSLFLPMEQMQAEEGLVDKEAAFTIIAELVKAMEGNESQQGGGETESIVYFEGNEKGAIESNDSIEEESPRNEKSDSNITKVEIQKSHVTLYDRKRDGNPKDDSLNDFHILPSEKLQLGRSLSLKDRRQEVIELDVERVIEEQDTHDLYCPNCNSCITKRVILRKRKRKISSIHYKEVLNGSGSGPATDETGTMNGSGSGPGTNETGTMNGSSSGTGSGSGPPTEPVTDETGTINGSSSGSPDNVGNHDTERPFIYKCLSCFCIFFPRALGTKPGSGEGENIPSPDPARNVNWFFSCFDPPKAPGTKPGSGEGENIQSPDPARNVNWFFSCFDPPKAPGTESGSGPKTGQTSGGSGEAENRQSPDPFESPKGDGVAVDISSGEDPDVDPPPRTHEWDILKSIIYGGLIETITSLGVVSSAAAGDATTLNIVVLGLANLISGLTVIIHNITELKNDYHEGTSEANSNINRYQETFGRRENFRLHAIVAVISFIVFGLLPPVTYGFSFRGSDDKSYKLIACAAASLVCIIILSIGKAFVQKPPKPYINTVLKYLFNGVTASGLCYAAGLLINRFLENLGWFETPSAPTTFLGTRAMKSGSAFYR